MARRKLEHEEIQAFRHKAVAAAERLFTKGGVAAVSMRELAKVLGCSPTTPYRYFDSHEALIAQLRCSVFSRFADAQAERIEGIDAPLARLEGVGRVYIEFALAAPESFRLMFDLEPPRIRHAQLEHESRRAFSYLSRAVEDAVQLGLLDGPADTVAHVIWAQLHGLVSLHVSNKLNFGLSIEELTEALFRDGMLWRSPR